MKPIRRKWRACSQNTLTFYSEQGETAFALDNAAMSSKGETTPRARYDFRQYIAGAAIRSAAAISCSVAVLLLIAVHWYRPGRVIAEIDLFPNYSPLTLLQKTLFAWSHATSPFGSFDLPTFTTYYAIQHLLTALTNPGLAQILSFWIMLACGWTGVFILCRSLRLGATASLCAAWTYVLNPYEQFLVPWITGSAFAAALPWIFWMLHKGAAEEKSRPRVTALAALSAFTVLPWVASTPQLFFELVVLALVWTAFLSGRAEKNFLRWAGWSAAACAVAAGWWLVPEGFALFGNTIGHATQTASVSWSFANSSLANNLRFVNVWTWSYPFYIPYANGYDANILTYAAGFFGIIALCIALFLKRTSSLPLVRFFAALALAGIFIAKGPHPPLEQINALIYKIPGFFLLIEAGGLTVAALLSLCVVLALLIKNANRVARTLLLAATVVAAFASASPMINGLLFSGRSEGGPVNSYISLPGSWRDAATYLNSAKSNGSVLVLPADRAYQTRYTWGYEGVDLLPAELLHAPSLLLGPSLDYLVNPQLESIKSTLRDMVREKSDALAPVLRQLGIQYVLCRGDVAAPLDVRSDCHVRFLARHYPVKRFGALAVYDLGTADGDFSLDTAYLTGTYTHDVGAGEFVALRERLNDQPRVAATLQPSRAAPRLSIESETLCEHTCVRRPLASAAFSIGSLPSMIHLFGANKFTIAFDQPQPQQTLANLNQIAPLAPASYHDRILFAVIGIIAVDGNDRIVYVYNPAMAAVQSTISISVHLRRGADVRCISAALNSPYVQIAGEPRYTLSDCSLRSKRTALFAGVNLYPGLSALRIHAPLARLDADDIRFIPGVGSLQSVPQRAVILSALNTHAMVPAVAATVSTANAPTLSITPANLRPDVNFGQVLRLRFQGRTYSCFVPGSGPVAIQDAARQCFLQNGISFNATDTEFERADADYSLAAGSLYPAARMAVLAQASLTASAAPFRPIFSSDLAGTLPRQVPQGSVIDLHVTNPDLRRMRVTIVSSCNGAEETRVFENAVPIQGALIDERFPVASGSCSLPVLRALHVDFPSAASKPIVNTSLLVPQPFVTVTGTTGISRIPIVPGRSFELPVRGDSVRLTPPSVDASVASLSRGTQRFSRVPLSSSTVFGFIRRVRVPAGARAALLVGRQSAHPTWFALGISPRAHVLRHTTVDGWRNAWWISGDRTVLIFNVVDLLEVLLAAAGFVVVLIAWGRSAWAK